MATRTISNAGGDWGVVGTWVEGAVPTTADDVVATATSGNVTISASGLCRSFDFTNYVGTLTINAGQVIQVGTSGAAIGNCKFVPGMTLVMGSSSSGLDLRGASGQAATLTMAGKTIGTLFVIVAQPNVVWTLQDALTCSGAVSLGRGILDLNGQTVNCDTVNLAQNTLVRELRANGATMNIAGGAAAWATNATNLTVTAATATLNFTGASPTFAGGGHTYGTANFTGTGTATLTGANTITTLTRTNAASGIGLVLPAGVTTTTTTFTMNEGTAGTPNTLASSSAGSAATLSLGNSLVGNHWTVQDITKAGAGSIRAYDTRDVSGNTGITFEKSKKLAGVGVG